MPDNKKVDESWKQQAQQEKEQPASAERPPLPEATFRGFLSGLAGQTLIHLGLVPNPISKKPEPDPEQAKYTIDLMQILKDKTEGNRTDEETQYLETVLYDLRMRYVNICR